MTHIEIKSSLSEERKQSLLDFLSINLASLGKEYELSTLDRVIITDEFTDDVIRVQKEYHLRELGHTDREDAIAIAKVLDRVIENELHQTIVINSNMMAGLFNPEYAQAAYHYFHHEICHVHDNYHQHKMFSRGEKAGSELNKLEDVLVCHANPIWKEYFAVRLSAQTIPVNEANGLPTKDLYVAYLLDLVAGCKKNIGQAIDAYRMDDDLDKLFLFLQEETSIMLKIAATTQGYLDGLNIGNHEVAQLIGDQIKPTFFFEAWEMQHAALIKLFDLYPDWNDVYSLLELGEAIRVCWCSLGIFPEYLPEQDAIYLNVPLD